MRSWSSFTLVWPWQQVVLGDDCYVCGEVGPFVIDCFRTRCSWIVVVLSLVEVDMETHRALHVGIHTIWVAMFVERLVTDPENTYSQF